MSRPAATKVIVLVPSEPVAGSPPAGVAGAGCLHRDRT